MALEKKTRSTGLKAAYFGDVTADGKMPELMKQLARTYKGTASFTTEADTTQDFYCEEEPTVPMESMQSDPGVKQVKLNFAEFDNETLINVMGGIECEEEEVTIDGVTYLVKKYGAPTEMEQIYKSVRIITRSMVVIDIPRTAITARFVWNLSSNELAQVEVTAKILSPVKSGVQPYYIYKLDKIKEGS